MVAFCTGQTNVDITNTTLGGNTFHDVSFTFDVTTANSTYEFGIKKVADDSYSDWCQIKDVKLILNSTNITPIDNSVTTGWTQTFGGDGSIGDFAANVASVEGNKDGTNYLAPFLQVWKASGNILSNQTISNTFTPTQTGVYKMSAWVRVYNESGGSVSGAKIFIGDTEADACTGTEITNGRLGTYTAMADGVAGTPITYGFKIEDASMNWISWKDVTFTYYSEMPEAEKTALLAQVPTGKMNATVQTQLNTYKTAFESNASVANYNALSLYIPTAVASVNAYTSINSALSSYATKVESLDAAGQAAYSATEFQTKYDNGTYESYAEAEAELSAAYIVAVKAQTTANSDMTVAVAGAACSSVSDFSNWSITGGEGANFELNTWSSESDASGLTVPFIQNWRAAGTPLNDATIRHAAITGLHAGNYKVTVFARTFNENNTTVYPKNVTFVAIGDDTWSVDMNSGTQAIYNSKSTLCYGTYTAYATLAEAGSIQFGFNISDATANWLAFKNVTLTLVSAEEVEAAKLSNAKANLTAALVDAPSAPTANVGTNAFQYNQSEVTSLSETIASAQEMLEDGSTATLTEVEEMIATVKALTAPTLNVPTDGQKFNVILTYSGYEYDQKAITYIANGRTDMGNYNVSYAAAANANLAQAFTFTQVSGNNYKMSQIDADGNTRYLSTGVPYEGNTSQIRTVTEADDAMIVTVIPTTTNDVWNLYNVAASEYIGSQDAGVYTVNSHINFNIVEASQASVGVTISNDVKFATRIFPFTPTLPDGVKAYTLDGVSEGKLTLTEATTPAANVPYVLYAENGYTGDALTGWGVAAAETYTEGLLTGVYVETTPTAGTYVLQNSSTNGVGFFKVPESGFTKKIAANRCYMTYTAEAREAFFFDFGESTGIDAIEALTTGKAQIFNAAGAQVPGLQKGMNIIKLENGSIRKIMVK